jgi:hypothetical protein
MPDGTMRHKIGRPAMALSACEPNGMVPKESRETFRAACLSLWNSMMRLERGFNCDAERLPQMNGHHKEIFPPCPSKIGILHGAAVIYG